MKKKVVTLLLATAMVTTSLYGCGMKSADSAASASTQASAATEAVTESAAEPAETEPYTATEEYGPAYEYSDTEACTETECYPEVESYSATQFVNGAASAAKQKSYRGMASADTEEACCEFIDDGYWAYNYQPNPGETYAQVEENKFELVSESPLSTFGADVDTASYSNFRRMVSDGYGLYDIPAGSIRAEEMINYFNYDYKAPKKGEPFGVTSTICDCPWNADTKLLTLGIKAKEIKSTEKIASNIVFLVDVSGSMSDYDKLPLLQMGFEMLADDLDKNDRVSIVTYASDSEVVLAGARGNETAKIKKAMNSLSAGGSTNGESGIKKAYKLAEKYFIEGGNNRIIMATDGDLNVGVTSEDELEKLVTRKKKSGVFLSVLGFGTGNYNESKLETLADKGNGNYSYIDSLKEAKKVLVDEFDSTLFTVAKDVKFQIEFNPEYVSSYRQIGYENRAMAAKDFNDDSKDGGEIGSGHTITVMYEIELNDRDKDEDDGVKLRYQKNNLTNLAVESGEWMMVSVRYKNPDEDESNLLTFPISKECYTKNPSCDTLFAASVAELSMILNHSGDDKYMSLDAVADRLADLDLDDEYKQEFAELVNML